LGLDELLLAVDPIDIWVTNLLVISDWTETFLVKLPSILGKVPYNLSLVSFSVSGTTPGIIVSSLIWRPLSSSKVTRKLFID
jgi:hypothetical protein